MKVIGKWYNMKINYGKYHCKVVEIPLLSQQCHTVIPIAANCFGTISHVFQHYWLLRPVLEPKREEVAGAS